MREEAIVGSLNDPDFGPLELVETKMQVSVDGGPMRSLVNRSWRSVGHSEGCSVLISSEDDPPLIPDDVRSTFRSIQGSRELFIMRIAKSQLSLASEWAKEGDLDLQLDERSFAKLLRLDGFSIDPRRLTVFLQEDAGIFAGHALEIRIEDGEISEVCLAG